jgi:EAL domain-containing protein (putative c-di-GMP-specific phosphodiesterase class I)
MAACFSASQIARRDKKLRFSVHDSSPARLMQIRSDALLANRVINAIEAGNMRLAFQPVVEAASGRVVFHEALIRMVDGEGRTVEAGEFLPLAERLGFMRIIDSCALDLAMDTLQAFPQARLSINVSNASAEDPDWLSKLASRLRMAPDIAPRLIVEITESHAATDLAETCKFVKLLKDIGCAVAVDDFGAGYTSFTNLRALPVDIIKIDGTFARNLSDNRQNQVFIRSLLELARAFNVKTVVEWVENAETAAMLAGWGVDYLQGHRFGPASTACPFGPAERILERKIA